eukprot:CAMPEP_0194214942 /NCGR_PEP_ID=MMETSP0156-20130528/16384_1 /TAXON_ID=33649 /ORGANISM="Thalassionema nitzschioides, Strain L26-B" /LENGTH=31 /DNA_ID= /DNA_START= /DNA_END= /DNA_ORIENTATION=
MPFFYHEHDIHRGEPSSKGNGDGSNLHMTPR